MRSLDLRTINVELDALVPPNDLAQLASRGIRGELLFAVPCLLNANPKLLGYYRLLLGFSQKEFYNKSKLAWLEGLESKGADEQPGCRRNGRTLSCACDSRFGNGEPDRLQSHH